MKEDSFYTATYVNFGDGGKNRQRSSPDDLTQWIITQFKGFTRKGII